MPSTDEPAVVASYVPVYCRPEMRHVHRQITGMTRWRAHVITQRRENLGDFPLPDGTITVLPKYRWRFFRRLWFTQWRKIPWPASTGEVAAVLATARASGARVIHIYFGHMALHWLPLLRVSPLPVVVSFHGADAGVDMVRPVHRAMMAEVFARAAMILARSQALLDDLAALGCPREKLALNRTGIPLEEFSPVARAAPPDGCWHILQGGRLIAKKDHACTLAAFARLRASYPQARLRVAGDGPLLGELQALAGTLGVADAVDWLGFLGPAAMRAELAAAHVFVHPSVTGPDGNREGVPNAMLEAMATGLPVVATRHGGIPEAVQHGQSGILIDERDTTGLAEAVCALLANDADRERLGIQAAASVAAHFSRPAALAALAALEGIYDKVAITGRTIP